MFATFKGPSNFQGEVGRQLNSCTKLPVTKFERIRCHLDALNIDLKVLSKVQKYLFEFCCGINSGKISQRLENLEPGPAVHSRWLTIANGILRLYVTKKESLSNLKILADMFAKYMHHFGFRLNVMKSGIMGSSIFGTFFGQFIYFKLMLLQKTNFMLP